MQKKTIAILIALAFLLIVSMVIVSTRADDTAGSGIASTTATIQNAAPTVDSIAFSTTQYGSDNLTSGGILPSIGADRTIYVTGVISDASGDVDIASTSLAFYRSAFTSSCTSDKNNCYHVATCDIDAGYGTDTQAAFSCTVSLAYWTDATDSVGRYASGNWVATVVATDALASTGTSSATIEVNSLLALNIPTAINYGTRSLGEQSTATSNVETVLVQKGNAAVDLEVYGTTMSCGTLGSLGVSNQRWSLLDEGYSATSSNTLSGTSSPTLRNILFRENDAVELAESLYWNIAIPATGVKGTCTGANTLAIVAYPGEDGFFMDGRLANIAYDTGTVAGRTGSNGSFKYYPGDTVTFSIGAVTLGSIAADDVPGDQKVTLADMLGLPSRSNLDDTELLAIARFLQALDSDPSSTSTITIPETAHTALVSSINFASVSDGSLTTQLQTVYATGTLPSVAQAQAHLASTYASENITTYSAPTVTLSAETNPVVSDTSTNLSWTSAGANTCTASGGWSGSQATTSAGVSTGNLTVETTFTITCTGYGGAASSSVTITIDEEELAWTSRTTQYDNMWNGVAYGNGTFAAVSSNGIFRIMTSTDGATWTDRSAGLNEYRGVAYGGGIFVAVAQSSFEQIRTSSDGETWTTQASPETNQWQDVAYGNGTFVAVANSGTNRVMTSPDGTTWTSRSASEEAQWQDVTFGNGTFVAVSYEGKIMTSSDGESWTSQFNPEDGDELRSVAYGNSTFVAVGTAGQNLTSINGSSWAASYGMPSQSWTDITFGNGNFVAISDAGTGMDVVTSQYGNVWTPVTTPTTNAWQSVTFGANMFVAVSNTGSSNSVMTYGTFMAQGPSDTGLASAETTLPTFAAYNQTAAVVDALEPLDDSFLEHLRSWVVTALVYMLYTE